MKITTLFFTYACLSLLNVPTASAQREGALLQGSKDPSMAIEFTSHYKAQNPIKQCQTIWYKATGMTHFGSEKVIDPKRTEVVQLVPFTSNDFKIQIQDLSQDLCKYKVSHTTFRVMHLDSPEVSEPNYLSLLVSDQNGLKQIDCSEYDHDDGLAYHCGGALPEHSSSQKTNEEEGRLLFKVKKRKEVSPPEAPYDRIPIDAYSDMAFEIKNSAFNRQLAKNIYSAGFSTGVACDVKIKCKGTLELDPSNMTRDIVMVNRCFVELGPDRLALASANQWVKYLKRFKPGDAEYEAEAMFHYDHYHDFNARAWLSEVR